MPQPYFDSAHVTITWDDALTCVHAVWRGFVPTAILQEGMETILRLLIEKKGHLLLVDLRELTLTDIGDQTWLAAVWISQAANEGLQFAALILPTRAVARLGVKTVVHKTLRNFHRNPIFRYARGRTRMGSSRAIT